MCVHIAVAEPTGNDPAYNQRTLPAYLAALRSSGATPIIVPLHERQDRVARLLAGVQGVLLTGSKFDVDPQRYGESPEPATSEPDAARNAVDELLLQDAFNLHKPVLAICYGVQTLNVWLNGTLVQDLKTTVNHNAGRDAAEAHPVKISPGSRLAGLVPRDSIAEARINSTHHQAIRVTGDGLLVSAVSPEDGVVEAVELDSVEHFVLGVQWHPEWTYSGSSFSRAIFAAFVQAASVWTPRQIDMSVIASGKSLPMGLKAAAGA